MNFKDERLSTSIPHPPFAQYACRGFKTEKAAIDNAKENCPYPDFATRDVGESWEWYWPSGPVQTTNKETAWS